MIYHKNKKNKKKIKNCIISPNADNKPIKNHRLHIRLEFAQ